MNVPMHKTVRITVKYGKFCAHEVDLSQEMTDAELDAVADYIRQHVLRTLKLRLESGSSPKRRG
jgi:hypothetical protein